MLCAISQISPHQSDSDRMEIRKIILLNSYRQKKAVMKRLKVSIVPRTLCRCRKSVTEHYKPLRDEVRKHNKTLKEGGKTPKVLPPKLTKNQFLVILKISVMGNFY